MSPVAVRRTGSFRLSLVAIVLLIELALMSASCVSAAGPPFVWVCTPGNLDFGNNGNAEVSIFNGGGATATLATHFLAKNGVNVSGGNIPTSSPTATYPGQTGSSTVTLPTRNTLILPFLLGGGVRATNNNLMASVMVTSDQPIVVGMQMANGPLNAVPCNALPK
jgi:hypothetical protein